jgi:hypothetical protein
VLAWNMVGTVCLR